MSSYMTSRLLCYTMGTQPVVEPMTKSLGNHNISHPLDLSQATTICYSWTLTVHVTHASAAKPSQTCNGGAPAAAGWLPNTAMMTKPQTNLASKKMLVLLTSANSDITSKSCRTGATQTVVCQHNSTADAISKSTTHQALIYEGYVPIDSHKANSYCSFHQDQDLGSNS